MLVIMQKSLPCLKGDSSQCEEMSRSDRGDRHCQWAALPQAKTEGYKIERKHNTKLTANAKALRKNMTKEERHLWYDFLRLYPIRFLRQKIIDNYIVDFYCHEARLIIELDGSQHYEKTGC